MRGARFEGVPSAPDYVVGLSPTTLVYHALLPSMVTSTGVIRARCGAGGISLADWRAWPVADPLNDYHGTPPKGHCKSCWRTVGKERWVAKRRTEGARI